jgi:hypothetical protein
MPECGTMVGMGEQTPPSGHGEWPSAVRPIDQWDPHDLEIHPAIGGARDELPTYVAREHDRALAKLVVKAASGTSAMAVLVGGSSTGKTRACWEAVRPLADQGWLLWHPSDHTRPETTLAGLQRVGPRTVVWLNEAQHTLGAPDPFGGRVSDAVHHLLTDRARGPVLILGTLWPDYAAAYTAVPKPGSPDPYSRLRELLAGRTVSVPECFDRGAMATLVEKAAAGDRQLAHAARYAASGRVAQFLAGAPELLRRFEQAPPGARAVLEAAMDARRLGAGLHLPAEFLVTAAEAYLDDEVFNALPDAWFEEALMYTASPVHGRLAPLRRVRQRAGAGPHGVAGRSAPPGGYRLADYLEHHGSLNRRGVVPPTGFWYAAEQLADPSDLTRLAFSATARLRLAISEHLFQVAAERGDSTALRVLALSREEAGMPAEAERLARAAAEHGDTGGLVELAWRREKSGLFEDAERLARAAADHGDTDTLSRMAWQWKEAGDRAKAEHLYQGMADQGDANALYRLARLREEVGDRAGAERHYRAAADHGNTDGLHRLARLKEESGDGEAAERLYREAAGLGHLDALRRLARMREDAGDREGAEAEARRLADQGHTDTLRRLARVREAAGDRAGAERAARTAADRGDTLSLHRLVLARQERGEWEEAERLALVACEYGDTQALRRLAGALEATGDRASAERLVRAADEHEANSRHGHPEADRSVAWAWDEEGVSQTLPGPAAEGDTHALLRQAADGEVEVDERLARAAAEQGNTYFVRMLMWRREEAGDREGAEELARAAAEYVSNVSPVTLAWMRDYSEGAIDEWAIDIDPWNDRTDTSALRALAMSRETAGDHAGAERLARVAAHHGDTYVLNELAQSREAAGNQLGAEHLARIAADHGDTGILQELARERGDASEPALLLEYGLEPDGTPSPRGPDHGRAPA